MADTSEVAENPVTWSVSRRICVSLLITFHICAVIIAPLGIVEPRSQLFDSLRTSLQPYLHAMFLDHGYRFFAPEPGPGHIVRYEITDENGNTQTGQFPDRERIWPRLLYHRWFMLSETMNSHARLILDDEALRQWKREVDSRVEEFKSQGNLRRANQFLREYKQQLADYGQIEFMLNRLTQDVGRVLLRKYPGTTIRMSLVTRLIPSPFEINDGQTLDDVAFTPKELEHDLGIVGQGREVLEVGPLGPSEAGAN